MRAHLDDRRARFALLYTLVSLAAPPPPGFSSVTYATPFHSSQCQRAINHAGARSASIEDARAARILAEGQLCKGIALDDHWLLEAALAYFGTKPQQQSQSEYFDGLYRVSALTRRYPLSDELPALIERLIDDLETADVGAARDELRSSLAADAAAVERRRDQFLARLQRARAKAESGDAMAVDELLELIALESQTGRAGVKRATAVLDDAGRGRVPPAIEAFYRAELSRGLVDRRSTLHLYEIAEQQLCRETMPTWQGECARVRHRIDQLRVLLEGESL